MKRILFTTILIGGCLWAEAGLTVRSLSCEQVPEPLGIETAKPRFSWKLEADNNGQEQIAYQILVADSLERLSGDDGNLWDSRWVKGKGKLLIPYAGRALSSLQNAWWKVRVQDREGKPSAWSSPARFATGLLPGTLRRASGLKIPRRISKPTPPGSERSLPVPRHPSRRWFCWLRAGITSFM